MKLLIFKVNQLGDNIVFLPVVQELRRRFPHWELAIFTSPLAEALYEADIPSPSRRFVMPTPRFNGAWKRPSDFWRLWRKARKFSPDACLIADDQANAAYALAFLSGARVRASVRRPFIKIGALATLRLPESPNEKIAHTNWRIAKALVEAVGGEDWPMFPPPPDLSHLLGDSDRTRAGCRIVIHPGASRAYQRWFFERYVELANRLSGVDGMEVVWIEVPGESDERLHTLSPKVTRRQTSQIRDLAQILAGADLFVGNNSGPMHMANALGLPCVIINGPTSYHWDSPWHAERMLMLRDETLSCLPCDSGAQAANFCRRAIDPMACMKSWAVESVFERCLEWTQRWKGRLRPPRVSDLPRQSP